MQEYQETLFRHLFEDTAMKEKYFHKIQKRYLVETYLAPLDSFVTPALQKAALTYGNIAPMWKIIRDNSWSRVEKHIKYLVQVSHMDKFHPSYSFQVYKFMININDKVPVQSLRR